MKRHHTDIPDLATLRYMREAATQHSVSSASLMDTQNATIRADRCLIAEWVSELGIELHMLPEVSIRAIRLFDRYASTTPIARKSLQLVASSAFWIASKIVYDYAPYAVEMIMYTDNAYSCAALREMELIVMSKLEFKLLAPNTLDFIEFTYHAVGNTAYDYRPLAYYLFELSRFDIVLMDIPDVTLATAAVFISHWVMFGQYPKWTFQIEHIGDTTRESISFAIKSLLTLHESLPETILVQAYDIQRHIDNSKRMRAQSRTPDAMSPVPFT